MQYCHELGKSQSSQEGIVCGLEIGHLKLYGFSLEIFLSPEGHEKRDLTDGFHCCTWDYAMERSSASAWKISRQSHLVESLQKKNNKRAATIDEDSVELDISDNGADNHRISPRLRYKVWVVAVVKGNGDLRPFKVLGVAGLTTMTSRAVSFCFLLGSYEPGSRKM
jgi:hypothetical protein